MIAPTRVIIREGSARDSGVAQQGAGRTGSAADRAERDRMLQVIAVFKIFKSVLLVAVGLGALKIIQPGVANRAGMWLDVVLSGVARDQMQNLLARAIRTAPTKIAAMGVGAFIYAALFAVEGVGLWLHRRWAEYLTIGAAVSFLPFEVFELVKKPTGTKVSALILNLAIVGYLLIRLRRHRHDGRGREQCPPAAS